MSLSYHLKVEIFYRKLVLPAEVVECSRIQYFGMKLT